MDGLSVASSVAGLIQLSGKIISIISATAVASSTARSVLAKAHGFQGILTQLQVFITNFEEESDDQRSMIYVEQLVATLTDCVCAFSELDRVLESLNKKVAGSRLGLWDSAKWALKDSDIGRILGELQKHKNSLALMMMIITWCAIVLFQLDVAVIPG